jgi:uncharacterized OB-fold protein
MEMWKCHTQSRQLPIPDEDSQVFWEGCRRHRLLIQQCDACAAYRFPPSPVCPQCLSPLTAWREDPGAGEVLTFCVYHSELAGPAWRHTLPYVVAVVHLRCSGVNMLSNVVGVAPERVNIGMPVRVVFESIDPAVTLPKFVPRGDDAAHMVRGETRECAP